MQAEEINGYIRENWILRHHVDFQTWLGLCTEITTKKRKVTSAEGSLEVKAKQICTFYIHDQASSGHFGPHYVHALRLTNYHFSLARIICKLFCGCFVVFV